MSTAPNYGIKNFIIKEFDIGHGLFLTNEEDECMFVQNKGAELILSLDHLYIDTCASYPSMLYTYQLDNLMKQLCGLCGHTNCRSTCMDMAGDLDGIKKMWLNECGVVSVVPLKELDMIWPILYHSKKRMNPGHLIYPYRQGGHYCEEQLPWDAVPQPQGSVETEVSLCLITDTIKTVWRFYQA
jgi:hypothetical protein